jgi:hypothetical protein
VLEFDDNDVDCERGVEKGGREEGNMQLSSRQISKISTTLKYSLFEFHPPPKNILFVDDVDASE